MVIKRTYNRADAIIQNELIPTKIGSLSNSPASIAFLPEEPETAQPSDDADLQHLDELKEAAQHGFPFTEIDAQTAAMRGFLQSLKFLQENVCPMDARVCEYAAEEGFGDVLKCAMEKGCPTSGRILLKARSASVLKVALTCGAPLPSKFDLKEANLTLEAHKALCTAIEECVALSLKEHWSPDPRARLFSLKDLLESAHPHNNDVNTSSVDNNSKESADKTSSYPLLHFLADQVGHHLKLWLFSYSVQGVQERESTCAEKA